jgi:hypothetical protein
MSQMDGIEAGFHLRVIAASQEVKDEPLKKLKMKEDRTPPPRG